MRIVNGDPTILEGNEEEQITVAVSAAGSKKLVAYALNLQPWDGGSFELDRHVANPFLLLVQVAYSGREGGSYKIVLTGSEGGESVIPLRQSPGQADDAVAYKIDIVPH
jgi:hypothetical protein